MNIDMAPILTVIGACIAFVVYVIRQEGKVAGVEKLLDLKLKEYDERIEKNSNDITKIIETRDVLYRKVMDELSAVNRCLARIEGRLAFEDSEKN